MRDATNRAAPRSKTEALLVELNGLDRRVSLCRERIW